MAAVPGLTRWWSSRSDTDRIEIYTRWSFHVTLLGMPFLLLVATVSTHRSRGPLWDVALAVAALTTAVACSAVTEAGFRRGVVPRGPLAAAVVAGAATVGLGLLLTDARTPEGVPTPTGPWYLAIVSAAVIVSLSVTTPYRTLLGWSGLAAVLSGVLAVLRGSPPVGGVVVALSIGVALGAFMGAFRFSVWLLDVVREQERARGVQAQLAVAEERLRFARDLHDVMGRNLSAIAVKSQLAEQLVRRGRPEAAEEVAAIGALAGSSLAEVREVVRGYRAVDLRSELAGARSVLRAAGIDCTVTGEDVDLAEEAQVVLGWVVREAVTNVLRHGSGTCTIAVTRNGAEVRLTVTNDVRGDVGAWGSGLTGLAERLAAAGGRLTAERRDSAFVLVGEVPA
ncbi:two-component system, NarL family, sensor histidine kinase DesK [Klenkia marina]|uniref:Two-component system, NarL family, sensor histidine kinase DesK n=1 Tax=Klenkia marina TaxID=1960309 RepID=A0A1G4XVF5_9ACTN|nr:two-component system, NarL family, sensor histidine kinase DesK [Klenkia marina]